MRNLTFSVSVCSFECPASSVSSSLSADRLIKGTLRGMLSGTGAKHYFVLISKGQN